MRSALSIAVFAALAACTTPMVSQPVNPAIIAALDSQNDGFAGATSSGQRFRIESTSASQTRLCRVVSIESADRFEVESFCKAPGGSWR